MGLGFGEIVLLVLVFVLFFGGRKLPELGKAMGKAVVNFKSGLNDDEDENTKLEQRKKS